jgi:hypothetical protein
MKITYPLLLYSVINLASLSLTAATFTVTTTNFSGPGSLPIIVDQANAAPGNNTIQFSVTGTITIAATLPAITNSVVIIGPAVINGGGAVPIFNFAADTTSVLSNLTIEGGNTGGNGGAVYNSGSLSIADSQLINNQAGNGGGIYNVGSLQISTTSITSNSATLGFGGGIYNAGALSISQSTLAANQASGGPGSTGRAGGGGGAGLGGGLFISNGVVAITNCTFYANVANGGDPGSCGTSGNGGNGGGNDGGNGASSTSATTPGGYGGGGGSGENGGLGAGNGANGGFGGGGGAAGAYEYPVGSGGFGGGNGGGSDIPYGGGGGGGAGLGAGIFVESGTVSMVNCTITGGAVAGGSSGCTANTPYSQPGQGIGGGIFNHSGTVGLLNTITAGNSASSSSADLYGAFSSSGFNLIGTNQGATGLSISDLQDVAADLGPLQNNGGPTLTCALLPGSLCILGGTSVGAPPTDQRDIVRPVGQCDIGAYQYTTLISPSTATANSVLTNGFVVGVNITDGGYGYTNTPTVRIIGGGGTGAQAVAVVSNGVIIAVNVLDAGDGYTSAPLVVINPPLIPYPVLGIAPMSFLAFSNLTVGGVYQLQQSVAGYWTNQPVSFTATNALYTQMVTGVASGGDYQLARSPVPAQAFATPEVVNGFVVGATVTSGGSGYVTSPMVSIVDNYGSNATAISQISSGVVANIIITDAGIGYSDTPTIEIAPPPATAISPTVSPVMQLDSANLAPYNNYQIQFTPTLGATWMSWNGGLFTPTDVTNSQYLFITNGTGFFRLQYVP